MRPNQAFIRSPHDHAPMRPPLPPPPPLPRAAALQDEGRDAGRYAWLFSPLLYLTVSVVIHGYRARADPPNLAFILLYYLGILTLCFVVRRFERLGPESTPGERTRLRAAVWALSTALMAAFGYRAAEAMPPPLAAAVWLVAGAVAAGGFYGFFLYEKRDDEKG